MENQKRRPTGQVEGEGDEKPSLTCLHSRSGLVRGLRIGAALGDVSSGAREGKASQRGQPRKCVL